MPGSEERLLGNIEATVNGIAETQAAYRLEDTRAHEIIAEKIDDQTQSISGLRGEFKAHVKDDTRQFSIIWKILLGAGTGGAVLGVASKVVGGP